ncbi:hypothetical protein LZG74_25520 [Dyadobacter sp. CY327]|uniref:hypothetical protein n=1 Tax=Dyadobacter sp. CY327 TaxID=2907301 RepID=UPI001F264520|nr:hypothetical protein [Dyadobacter sp. CY327]MCE7073695.1 hypothetical protein [Dyadobacter sp. CY327]
MKPWEQFQPQTPVSKPWEQFAANKEPTKEVGVGRTAFDQALQGATFGFADEATDALAAGVVSPFVDESFSDLYNQARQSSKEQLNAEFEQNPGTSIAANIVGGLVTGGAGATTKAGQSVGNFIRSGNTAARIGKGALAGAASGGAYGAGSANDGERIEGAQRGGLLGGVAGAAIPVVGAAAGALKSKPSITSDMIKAKSSEAYKLADEAGGVLTPNFSNKFAQSMADILPKDEIGIALSKNNPSTKIVGELNEIIQNKPLTLQNLQAIDEFLGNKVDDLMDAGRLTKEGRKVLDIQDTLRNLVDSADDTMIAGGKEGFESLKEGRRLWSAQAKLRDIEKIIARAEMTDNPATAIKTGFRNLALNEKRLRGFSPEQRKAINKAAESGIISDTLRTLGSRLTPIIAGASGGGLGATALAQAGSMASRGAATKMQVGKAAKVARMVADDAGITIDDIMKLPPAEAQKLLKRGK